MKDLFIKKKKKALEEKVIKEYQKMLENFEKTVVQCNTRRGFHVVCHFYRTTNSTSRIGSCTKSECEN